MAANAIFFLSMLIAIEHLWFAIMGLLRWRKGFAHDLAKFDEAAAEKTNGFARYLAVHSALIGAALLWCTALYEYKPFHDADYFGANARVFVLVFVTAAGLVGGHFVNRSLYLIQAAPAVVLLAFIYLS